ncbi:hypothetical protein [Streptomyces muensis]|uniref:Uncharacterized protein n=1 Tax=Streptomyces muensis TaxID=1077944 RepID=A0A9X1TH54_STRM4|nr:hypothetical protein [Streptomyces muensis]MCF1592391.1 hypothetical protein [Streptomyces muensis]
MSPSPRVDGPGAERAGSVGVVSCAEDLDRLILHGEQLRDELGAREQDPAGHRLAYDEGLHAAAHRLLTTIDLLTRNRETP